MSIEFTGTRQIFLDRDFDWIMFHRNGPPPKNLTRRNDDFILFYFLQRSSGYESGLGGTSRGVWTRGIRVDGYYRPPLRMPPTEPPLSLISDHFRRVDTWLSIRRPRRPR